MHDFVRGDIVRVGDCWGVVKRTRMDLERKLIIDWWVGQYEPHKVPHWYTQRGGYNPNISAPFANDYPGIPDQVVARSMAIILDGEHA